MTLFFEVRNNVRVVVSATRPRPPSTVAWANASRNQGGIRSDRTAAHYPLSMEAALDTSKDSAEKLPSSLPTDWRIAGWGVMVLTAILYLTRLGAKALWAS